MPSSFQSVYARTPSWQKTAGLSLHRTELSKSTSILQRLKTGFMQSATPSRSKARYSEPIRPFRLQARQISRPVSARITSYTATKKHIAAQSAPALQKSSIILQLPPDWGKKRSTAQVCRTSRSLPMRCTTQAIIRELRSFLLKSCTIPKTVGCGALKQSALKALISESMSSPRISKRTVPFQT